MTSRHPDTRNGALVRLDQLLADKAKHQLVAANVDVVLDACHERLRSLFSTKIVKERAVPNDYYDVVKYVHNILTELYSYPEIVSQGSVEAVQDLLQVTLLILNEASSNEGKQNAYEVIGRLRGFLSDLYQTHWCVALAHLNLLQETDDFRFRSLVEESLTNLAERLPEFEEENTDSIFASVVSELTTFLARNPNDVFAVKSLLVAFVKSRGPSTLDLFDEIEFSEKFDILRQGFGMKHVLLYLAKKISFWSLILYFNGKCKVKPTVYKNIFFSFSRRLSKLRFEIRRFKDGLGSIQERKVRKELSGRVQVSSLAGNCRLK